MDIKNITTQVSVSGQIVAADVPAIAQAGFKSLICNRPDGEGADQPSFKEIEQAAMAAGLPIRYLPAESGKVTREHGAAFAQLLDELPKPILAYCRSGMRSTILWALASASNMPLPQVIEIAAKAGYDLRGMGHSL